MDFAAVVVSQGRRILFSDWKRANSGSGVNLSIRRVLRGSSGSSSNNNSISGIGNNIRRAPRASNSYSGNPRRNSPQGFTYYPRDTYFNRFSGRIRVSWRDRLEDLCIRKNSLSVSDYNRVNWNAIYVASRNLRAFCGSLNTVRIAAQLRLWRQDVGCGAGTFDEFPEDVGWFNIKALRNIDIVGKDKMCEVCKEKLGICTFGSIRVQCTISFGGDLGDRTEMWDIEKSDNVPISVYFPCNCPT